MPGEIIFQEGTVCDRLYYVCERGVVYSRGRFFGRPSAREKHDDDLPVDKEDRSLIATTNASKFSNTVYVEADKAARQLSTRPRWIGVMDMSSTKGLHRHFAVSFTHSVMFTIRRDDLSRSVRAPREKSSRTLANFLRNRGFTLFYKPPSNKGHIPDDAPIEARLPSAIKELSPPLGCMLACKKKAHWSIHLSQPLIKLKKGSPRIAAARLAAPNLQPMLLVCTCLPAGSGKPDIMEYSKCCSEINTLIRAHPGHSVILGGDTQFQWNTTSPKGKLITTTGLRSLTTHLPPSFDPCHNTHETKIDHFALKDELNTIPENRLSVSNIRSSFGDHHTVMCCAFSTSVPRQNEKDPDACPNHRKLQLPITPQNMKSLKERVRMMLEQQCSSWMEDYEDRQPNPLRPITVEHFADLEHLGSTLTHTIGQAHNEALRTLPTTPIPGPKHNSGREYWPRAVRMDLANLRQRAGAIRSLLPDIRQGRTIDNALLPSLQQSPDLTTINIEPADNDEGSKPLSLPAQQSLNEETAMDCFRAHKMAAKKAISYATKLRQANFGRYLLTIFATRPKKAIQLLQKTKSATDTGVGERLCAIRDPSSTTIYTDPPQVLKEVHRQTTESLDPDPLVDDEAPFPWPADLVPSSTPKEPSMFDGVVTEQRYYKILKRQVNGKTPGPDADGNLIPREILKAMPKCFHKCLVLLFQSMAKHGFIPPTWLTSHTTLIYKKGDPHLLDNYRPIALASVVYKLWTGIITDVAIDFVEHHKIMHPSQEGFRRRRSSARAVAHLRLALEDAHESKRSIILTYIDFKGAHPSVSHTQLARVLDLLGLPPDLVKVVQTTKPVQGGIHLLHHPAWMYRLGRNPQGYAAGGPPLTSTI